MRARRYRMGTPPYAAPRVGPPQASRLPDGALYEMVLAHLRAYPDLDFSPAELARALGRPNSRGAIIKICWRLVEEQLVVRTQAKPQRYRLAPAA